MAAKTLPSAEDLRQLFRYDPETGQLSTISGQEAGWLDAESGYRRVFINGVRYRSHRVIWVLVHGYEPDGIDHVNGDRSDNRLANLRHATVAENNQNRARQRNNSSGITGVSFEAAKSRWRATIKIGHKKKHIGYFNSKEAAADAYSLAKLKLHEFHSEVVTR